MLMDTMIANKEATPAIRNRPQKLVRLRLLAETWVLESGQLVPIPSHAFSIVLIFSPSVTFKIALETSATRGEPFGKTYKSLTKKHKRRIYMRNYIQACVPEQTHIKEMRQLTKPKPPVLYIDATMVYFEQYCPRKSLM
jgi:hypothetical protein